MNKGLIRKKIFVGVLCLLALDGCNKFNRNGWLSSFGYNVDECEVRRRTHHRAPYADGDNPGRATIWHREFRCRIERICVGKSEEENEKCRQAARDYWIAGEGADKGKLYQSDKEFDDSWDAICTLNRNPWDPNFKGCSPKFHPQENYETNPYWDKKTKSYILPEVVKSNESSKRAK
jgi:hypothetical protein